MKRMLVALLLALVALVPAAWAVVTPPAAPEARPAEAGPPFVPGEVLLKARPGYSPQVLAAAVDAAVVRPVGDGGVVLLSLRRGDVPSAVAALAARAGVAFAEPNYLRRVHLDPDFHLKWDLHNDGSLCNGSDCATADADIDWLEAYNTLGAGFAGPAVVAVIDTGIDAAHPDLAGKAVAGYDYLDRDVNPADDYGHGTHVAGIALAATGNGEGTAGVGYSPEIKVMPLRVCDAGGCPTSAIVDAIDHATANGAEVINLSLGGPFGATAERQAIDRAWRAGLVIVASSGNDGSGKVSYPAAFPNAIAVGSTDWHDGLARYSNKGSALDLTAPGGAMSYYHDPAGIYSTMPTYPVYLTTAYGYGNDYDRLQGTSMAAPQVSGLAALLYADGAVADENGNGRINDEIRTLLETSADDLGSPGWDRSYGWGRINAQQAVLAARGSAIEPPPTPPPTGGALSVTVSAGQGPYVNRDTVILAASVGDGSDPVEGAAVHFTVTAPKKTLGCDAVSDAGGTATCSYKVNVKRDGAGSYTVEATASKAGYEDGSASASFEVR